MPFVPSPEFFSPRQGSPDTTVDLDVDVDVDLDLDLDLDRDFDLDLVMPLSGFPGERDGQSGRRERGGARAPVRRGVDYAVCSWSWHPACVGKG